jgi:ankyrin repeat protein
MLVGMKLKNNYFIKYYFFLMMWFSIVSCQNTWPGLNFELFENTNAEELAFAVKNENLEEIERIVREDHVNVNFQEPSKGNTILKVAVLAGKNNSIRKLLELGADPNLKDYEYNESAFLFSCANFSIGISDLDLIKLLVKYGADIDLEQSYKHNNGIYYQTPLMLSLDVSFEPNDDLFFYLVGKGANINKYGENETVCLLAKVVDYDRMDLLKFLIFEKKAKIPSIIKIWKTSTKKEEPETLIQVLKNKDYDRNSKNDLLRNVLIQYLISRGYK